MTTLLQILLYLWIAVTAMMIVTWYLRRRSAKAESSTDSEAATVHLSPTMGDMDLSDRGPTLHPALVGATDEPVKNSARSPESMESSDVPMGTTTTDTIDLDPEVVLAYDPNADEIDYDEINVDAADTETEGDDTEGDADNTDGGAADNKSTADSGRGEDGTAANTEPDVDHTTTEESEESVDAPTPLADLSAVPPRSLIDMLDGVKLPYDLTPVTAAVEDPDRHLIFLTTHSNAAEVGTRFADELIRIGYDFEAVGLDQAIATRGDDTISMTIVPKADEVTEASKVRYGAAGPGDVALELWIGQASTPPRAL